MFGKSISAGIYWTLKRVNGEGELAKRVHILEESQWLSPAALQELSFRKLEALVIHAFETVPYYNRVMKKCGFDPYRFNSFDQLKVLPLLTRDVLKENFEDLKSSRVAEYGAHESCSSGSTGKPARFLHDRNFDMWARAHQIRTYGWCGGWQPGERFALVWGSPVYWDRQTFYRKVESAVTNRIELDCNNVGQANLDRILKRLESFDPILISGYSTALYLLSKLAIERGLRLPSLRAVQPNAEPTFDYMASSMQQGFGAPVFDKYGSTETNIVSHQSPGNAELMCIQSENAHVEFLRPDGSDCKPGEQGFLAITTLNNYSMPLIRYETSDLAAPLDGQSPDGRGFPLMSKVRGRSYDLIVTAAGEFIHPQVFSNLFSNFPQVTWFQVVQDQPEDLNISLLIEKRDETLEARCRKMINLRTGGNFRILFTYMNEVPQSANGKHKICISNVGKNDVQTISNADQKGNRA